ncbi:leucine aminopeptidase 1 [Cladorrhinum sp. PSN332]|nr:leucine aminopeptidase 1 [Cladorrhinum sp. PSN332]
MLSTAVALVLSTAVALVLSTSQLGLALQVQHQLALVPFERVTDTPRSYQVPRQGQFNPPSEIHVQAVLLPASEGPKRHGDHSVDKEMLEALKTHSDPVDALVALRPKMATALAEPRLLHVFGEREARWMTEGDKLRLRRQKKKFMDITDHHEFYAQEKKQATTSVAGKANLPALTHQNLVKPLFPHISTSRMREVVAHMTSYYTRWYGGTHGEMSSEWLRDHIAQIIDAAQFGTHISLEYFTHPFPQSSIIARFEPKIRNASHPLTILGAHQDSANYVFPLLPAPGADGDCSGSVSILETFRVLAESGYTPKTGPVEFHWYAAEEGGLLGSQAIDCAVQEGTGAEDRGHDGVSFIGRNATESIGLVATQADAPLTNWTIQLSKEYISIPAKIYEMAEQAGSDYMSYTQLGYPATFATEGDPMHNGFPGDMDPYVHGVNDTMDIDDETGYFSFDHMARFAELGIAFAVEQAGWDNKWR